MEVQLAAWMPGPILSIFLPFFLSRWIAGALYTQTPAFLLSASEVVRSIRFAMSFSTEQQAGLVPFKSKAARWFSRIARFRISLQSPGEAIQFAPNAAGAHLTITDSVFANNGNASGGGGIVIQPASGVVAGAVIERTQVVGNTHGIFADGSHGMALVEVKDSTIADNTLNGIWAYTTGSTANIIVEHSVSVRNGSNGIYATGAGAYVSLNYSTVAWNATGLATSTGGLVLTFKNNVIGGNVSDGVTPQSIDLK